jgi:AmmeMemoRadiSam system protein A
MLSDDDKKTLLDLAHDSILYGLEHGTPLKVAVKDYTHALQENGAAFVTLHINDQLRGCIGSLEAYRPLAEDVAEHGFDAAFRDPRFPPLRQDEFKSLDIHIEVLNPAEAMTFTSEDDLLAQLRPGLDGLILSDGFHKGTFLPTVWESLQTPQEFFNHLKQKAGLPMHHWSDTIKVERYTTEGFSR